MSQELKPLVDELVSPSPGSEEEKARALAERYRMEYVDVESFAPDPEILKSVPVELMFRYNFLPYKRDNGHLVLVMADRTEQSLVVDELKDLLRTPVRPAVGTPERHPGGPQEGPGHPAGAGAGQRVVQDPGGPRRRERRGGPLRRQDPGRPVARSSG